MLTQMRSTARNSKAQRGFTMLELAVATLVLLVGIVSVVQLVPASIQNNSNSRQDTMATVVGQRILEQLALQPVTATTFVNSDGQTLSLGNPATPGVVVGSPLIAGTATINFAQATVAGYNLQYVDPNNANSGIYDVRWAVITTVNGGTPIAKRFILSTRRTGVSGIRLISSLDTTASR